MAKVKYTYDSKTLSYRKIERTWKQKLQDAAVFGAVAMAFGVVFYLAADLWFDSPKERRMKRELENMVLQYELMNGKLNQLTEVLGDIEKRDDEIYRAIFAGDLFRMYQRYCEGRGWKMEILTMNEGSAGGFKEVSFEVNGESVYGILKYESGVHRVQRVPATESQGRVHTSAASVVVLPEAEEVDVDLDMKDVKKDTYRSQGAGGQHVNKTESAVRLTHLPTGIVVECQDGRSQHKNYEQALKVLRSRMFDMEFKKKQEEQAAQRKTMVSTGDRSAKIRTYNYPQGRVTDHRIGLTSYNLNDVVNGDIQKFIDELHMAENAEKMKEGSDNY